MLENLTNQIDGVRGNPSTKNWKEGKLKKQSEICCWWQLLQNFDFQLCLKNIDD